MAAMHPLLKKYEDYLLDDLELADEYSSLRDVSRSEPADKLVGLAEIFAEDTNVSKSDLIQLLVQGRYISREDAS